MIYLSSSTPLGSILSNAHCLMWWETVTDFLLSLEILTSKNNVLNVLFDVVNMIITGPNGFCFQFFPLKEVLIWIDALIRLQTAAARCGLDESFCDRRQCRKWLMLFEGFVSLVLVSFQFSSVWSAYRLCLSSAWKTCSSFCIYENTTSAQER